MKTTQNTEATYEILVGETWFSTDTLTGDTTADDMAEYQTWQEQLDDMVAYHYADDESRPAFRIVDADGGMLAETYAR